MDALQTDLVVIGGGATGTGVAYDAALRGFDVVLVDRSDLAMGTSGRFHGLLHSGGRYIWKDQRSAKECMAENMNLRKIVPDAIEVTGGYFVQTPWDDPAYADKFAEGCAIAGIPTEELDPAEAFAHEPRLNRRISRVFTAPDASIDVWKMAGALAAAARAQGARTLRYHRVTSILRDGDAVAGVQVHDERTGEDRRIESRFVINASGAWAGEIAAMAGCEGVEVIAGKGIMIAMNHRLVNTVVNRCQAPADGDIIVPIRTVSVIGTTDIRTPHPDQLDVTQAEVDQMLDDGERLVPGFRQARALRVWAGARPLFKDAKADASSTRDVSRAHVMLDHLERDGLGGFLTITGGKLTTFRLMAEETVDGMCAQLGEDRPCTTDAHRLPGSEDGELYSVTHRLRDREAHLLEDQLVCECELIPRRRLEEALADRPTTNLDDIRRGLRLGMGPCQGGFCIYRAAGIMHSVEKLDGVEANASLQTFLEERWKGVHPILYGDQLRQAALDDWIFKGLLDVEHLPSPAPAVAPTDPVAAR